MNPIDRIIHKARDLAKNLVFPEGDDLRSISAATAVKKANIAKITVLGDVGNIHISGKQIRGYAAAEGIAG